MGLYQQLCSQFRKGRSGEKLELNDISGDTPNHVSHLFFKKVPQKRENTAVSRRPVSLCSSIPVARVRSCIIPRARAASAPPPAAGAAGHGGSAARCRGAGVCRVWRHPAAPKSGEWARWRRWLCRFASQCTIASSISTIVSPPS